MEPGPSIATPLFDVLARFRANNIAFIADIEKAFLQISLFPGHRDYVRFLWFKNIDTIDFDNFDNNVLEEWRICRVLFSLTASPFLLNATLSKHIKNYDDIDPKFTERFLNSLHVDDLNGGSKNVDEGFTFYCKVKDRLAEASFNMRKFQSNAPKLEALVNELYKGPLEVNHEGNTTKVLGLQWLKDSDKIGFNFEEIKQKFHAKPDTTKRNVLQAIASIFDPLGLINPIIVKMKTFFQDLYIKNVKWDSPLSEEHLEIWSGIVQELHEVSSIQIDRNYCYNDENDPYKSVQLHGFSDASKAAYGCCVYIRFETESGKIKTALVSSKSRVAPIKSQTIPRLELLGALMLARLLDTVSRALNNVYPIERIFAWIDSSVVYSWIKNSDKIYKPFVQNRLTEIRRLFDVKCLKLVGTNVNPADISSRGSSPLKLSTKSLWFEGPGFLTLPENEWPRLQVGDKFLPESSCEEKLSLNVNTEFTCLKSDSDVVNDACLSEIIKVDNYNSFKKLVRVTAYVLRFIRRCKEEKKRNEKKTTNTLLLTKREWPEDLSVEEIKFAKFKWLKLFQWKVQNNKNFEVEKVKLGLFKDDDGVLRCKGRVQNSPLPYDTRHPMFLPTQCELLPLIVSDSHRAVGHNGPRDTLCHVRKQFWIPRLRQVVRNLLRNCTLCKRFESKAFIYPSTSALPDFRLSLNFAFTNIGIDYAGPLYIRDIYSRSDVHKAWICLITCVSSRAVYLDISTDLCASTCVNVLKRFVNKNGAPKVINSDNGSNFISKEVQHFASSHGIKWCFNIEAAPWQGGYFERLIQSLKRCLKKVLFKTLVDYEEMLTILSAIERILNNRPLTFIYDDVNESPLTPNQLIYGKNVSIDYEEYDGESWQLTVRAKYIKTVLDHFWKRWLNEYVVDLCEFHKQKKKKLQSSYEIKVNDVVLIHDDVRAKWKIGRVRKLLKSKDARIRAAKVLVATNNNRKTIITRTLNKLYPVEQSDRDYENDKEDNDQNKIDFINEDDIIVFGGEC
ncbi:uncharacterized protein LOC130612911 [Hydractinia symbiolongicarpus]|uniref:uncharacterized protein LOC130612911 n=1 Tax=Hydractinia symbiolongicarpus TaxID=13093 RepID=UPI00254ACC1C|nr:uncharacterized protein LOC130612911 [Hydractinia symbiolongicarpus]